MKVVVEKSKTERNDEIHVSISKLLASIMWVWRSFSFDSPSIRFHFERTNLEMLYRIISLITEVKKTKKRLTTV